VVVAQRAARLTATAGPADQGTLFALLWALAALLHVLGNPTLASTTSLVVLGAGIAVVLAAPASPLALGALAVAQLATVWSEAPLLGNHWFLAGAVNLAVLIALAARGIGRRSDPIAFWTWLLPAARWSLLGFYAFAAFAKLNEGFFDADVSCASFYLAESADSLGISSLADPSRAVAWAAIIGTAAIETSVPLLLLWRRARHAWVAVAMAFHFVLALDRTHEFFDFSSVLLALFTLFLPATFAREALEALGRWRHVAVRIVLAAVALGLVVATARGDLGVDTARFTVGWPLWQALGLGTLAGTVAWLVRQRPAAPAAGALRARPAMLVVPVLVVLNGLTPYLEVKTAFGWNMYGNLRTVGGDSNHLLVRATLPLLDDQEHLVEIVESDDAGLAFYAANRYALTERRLRAYLHDHPDASLTYRQDGEEHTVERAGDQPDLVRAVPEWQRKLLVHRAVDLRDPPRCQDTFGPAQ
jgi:hypothetical protein